MILRYPHPVLSTAAAPAKTFSAHKTIKRMKFALTTEGGVGLAAPQIGISQRIILVKPKATVFAFINPEIIARSSGTNRMSEGCLSVPGKLVVVERHNSVTIKHHHGVTECHGMMARIVQHEIDHLDGITIVEREKAI